MESEEINAEAVASQAFDLVAAGDVSAAVAVITARVDTQAALEAFAEVRRRAYHDLKSVPTMVAIAWEAVEFGLKRAAASGDSENARRCKARVRAIAYNAGADCWPGWGDPVEINPADIDEGLKLAERSYELAEELDLGDKVKGGAIWLVGALQMAAGQWSTATAQFLHAEKAFHAAHLPANAAMARGYAALASKVLPESHRGDIESLAAILQSLQAMQSREAQFFADQLVTADRIFSKP